jgi:hypothetical protein
MICFGKLRKLRVGRHRSSLVYRMPFGQRLMACVYCDRVTVEW